MSLLTDDELVAVIAEGGLSWPVPLLTVEMSAKGLRHAAQVGLRSLMARDLVANEHAGLTFAPQVVDPIRAIAGASAWQAAYIADLDSPESVAGASTFVFETIGRSSFLDLVSAIGVHQFAESTAPDGSNLLIAQAKNVFDFGIRGADGGSRLFFGSNRSNVWVAVASQMIQVVHIGGEGDSVRVVETHDEFSETLCREVLDGTYNSGRPG